MISASTEVWLQRIEGKEEKVNEKIGWVYALRAAVNVCSYLQGSGAGPEGTRDSAHAGGSHTKHDQV